MARPPNRQRPAGVAFEWHAKQAEPTDGLVPSVGIARKLDRNAEWRRRGASGDAVNANRVTTVGQFCGDCRPTSPDGFGSQVQLDKPWRWYEQASPRVLHRHMTSARGLTLEGLRAMPTYPPGVVLDRAPGFIHSLLHLKDAREHINRWSGRRGE